MKIIEFINNVSFGFKFQFVKKLLLIFFFIPISCLAEEQNVCSTEQLITFGKVANLEICTHSHYPQLAKIRNEQGLGIIVFDFDTNWALTTVQVEKSTGSNSLDNGMRLAISKSQFNVPDCKPKMPTRIYAPFIFSLTHSSAKSQLIEGQLPCYTSTIATQ